MAKRDNSMYEEYGCADRQEYLTMLADENGLSYEVVFGIADMLGESEDFDGLVCEVEDYAMMYGSDY